MPKQKIEIEVPDREVPDGYELDPKPLMCMRFGGDFIVKLACRKIKQYREPVLPADAGKWCEFSYDNSTWVGHYLTGWQGRWITDSTSSRFDYCRIEKEPTE